MRSIKRGKAVQRAVLETLERRRLLSLAAPVSYAVGANPQAVATGDVNGDGRADVVTANGATNNVSVLLSNANGTLQPAQNFATGSGPRGVVVGDVNNDGKRDIVTANGGGNVSVLLGNGNGAFQPASNVTLPPQMPPGYTGGTPLAQSGISVAVGDLNADGKLDLVVSGQTSFYTSVVSPGGPTWYFDQIDSYVNVLLGNGNGTFATPNVYAASGSRYSIDVADFNNDNKLDVVTAGGAAQVWLGNGNGTLQQPLWNLYGFELGGDFDSDGKRDLVGYEGFAKGRGDGTFPNPANIWWGGNRRSLVAGDVNGDGKLDLVASTVQTTFESYGYYGGYNPTTTECTKVLLGKGDGTFTRGVSSTLGSYPDTIHAGNSSALGDFNADSRPDLVATDPRTGKIYVQLNEPGWIVPGVLTINDAPAVTEGNTGTVNANFTVTLAEAPAANVSVSYEVVDVLYGGATLAEGDYVATSGTLTFTPGQTTKTITVPVKGDRVGEPQENFTVRLSDATNAEIARRDGLGTINDDEPRIISLTGGTVVEGDSGTVPLTFTVTLSGPSDAPVTVSYGTQDYYGINNYATSATDYVPVTGTLTFAPGQTTGTFTVPVKGDLVAENAEQFHGTLTGSTNSVIAITPQAFGTITDTDPNPTISIANLSRAEGIPGVSTWFFFDLSLSTRSEKHTSVMISTTSGTATAGGSNRDYDGFSHGASVGAGELYGSALVEVFGDSRNESDETFFVNLSVPQGAIIADGQAIGTILNDDGGRGKTWVGPATGGSWSTAGNWSPSGIPTATSLVRIAGASVTVSASVTISELTLDDAATLTVAANGSRVLRTAGLFLDGYPSTTLNLNDNDMIIDYTAGAGAISPMRGWNRWNYVGFAGMAFGHILTTQPDALDGLTTLGIAEASQILGLTGAQTALFSGQTVDATTILVKYTYTGDADLDGQIDAADYGIIDNSFQFPGSSGYFNGDFNYDGVIDAADYGYIDNSFQMQGARL